MNKVLITGAGSGLGKAIALLYGSNGDEVCVSDMNSAAAEEVASLINSNGGTAFTCACDITDQNDVDQLAEQITQRWGSLDVLVNNAGVATAGSIESESMEQWQWVLDINLLGHVRMTKAMISLLRSSTKVKKNIINIASQAGITCGPGMGSYSVTKAAMVSFSETSYLEFMADNIHVSAVCPAFFDTNLNTSLRTDDVGMKSVVDKLIKKSGISADEIAKKIMDGVQADKFLIITHKQGRKVHYLKRFLPIERYLKIIFKQAQKLVKKAD